MVENRTRGSGSVGTPDGQPWRPRFGLGTLLLVMLVCAVTASGASYLAKAFTNESNSATGNRAMFVIFMLVAPMILLVVLSATRGILKLVAKFSRRR